jgi:hypothetical protein
MNKNDSSPDGREERGAKPILLVDAWQMSQQHPDDFFVPAHSEVCKLRAGDLVKVCSHGEMPERFWVQIVSRHGSIFLGRVDNRLLFGSPDLDDLIEFHECNVYEIHAEEGPGA